MTPRSVVSRRRLFAMMAGSALALSSPLRMNRPAFAAAEDAGGGSLPKPAEPFFRTRGVVISPSDFTTWPWPKKAKEAGLTTIATHVAPTYSEQFLGTGPGQDFLAECRTLGLEVEFEQHALADLLPRGLFGKNPEFFRMDDKGQRVPDANFCGDSKAAIGIVCENAVKFSRSLRPTTGRYFYWLDDGRPMCRCPECKGLSDSDQTLLIENAMLAALRKADPRASVAHLCYHNTLKPPTQVKPEPGVFLEFAPIKRQYDQPLSRRGPVPRRVPRRARREPRRVWRGRRAGARILARRVPVLELEPRHSREDCLEQRSVSR